VSQIIQLEVPDRLFEAIEREATAQGRDPASVAVCALNEHFERQEGSRKENGSGNSIRALFGAETEAPVTGLGNEAIDAELAKEYGRGLTN
jgi:hypothetical protein